MTVVYPTVRWPAVGRKILGMGDKKKQPFKGGQVGKPRENASPTGWFAPRNLSKSAPTDARSGPRSSGADPKKHPDRISRIIAKLTGRDNK